MLAQLCLMIELWNKQVKRKVDLKNIHMIGGYCMYNDIIRKIVRCIKHNFLRGICCRSGY